VLQGERSMARDNRSLGRFHLDGIPPAPRGVPQIEVTFDIDANGILNVSAKDKGTNKEQKIRIEAGSGLSDAEIKRMRDEAKANEATDKQERERVEKINQADTAIFQGEKQLKEYGDKISTGNKDGIEKALADLKAAKEAGDISQIDAAQEALSTAWAAASQEIYAAQQQAGGTESAQTGGATTSDQEVTDVPFEEVDSK
jgi:molecular chaperone DnaK